MRHKKEIKVADENNPPVYVNLTGVPFLAGNGDGPEGMMLFDVGLRGVPTTATSDDENPHGNNDGGITRTITVTVRNVPAPKTGLCSLCRKKRR